MGIIWENIDDAYPERTDWWILESTETEIRYTLSRQDLTDRFKSKELAAIESGLHPIWYAYKK